MYALGEGFLRKRDCLFQTEPWTSGASALLPGPLLRALGDLVPDCMAGWLCST